MRETTEVVPPLVLANKEIGSLLLYASRLRKSILQIPPEPIDRLGVHVPTDVLTRIVIDPIVVVSQGWKCAIDRRAIGVNRALTFHVFCNDWEEVLTSRVRDEPRPDHLKFPTRDAENGLFAGSSTPPRPLPSNVNRLVLPRATNVRLIGLADTREQQRHIERHYCTEE